MSPRLVILRAIQPVVARWPAPFYPIAYGVGWAWFYAQPGVGRNATRNMLPLFNGDRIAAKRAGRKAMQRVAQYYVDMCTVPNRRMESFEADHLQVVHGERLEGLRAEGPVIVVSAHSGNAELAIQALTYRGRPFVALVEAQQPPEWSQFLLRLRSSAGGTFYQTDLAGVRACVATLKRGGLVGFMADRDIQGNGLCTDLLGRRVRLPTGPWELARRTDALVFPIFSSRVKKDQFRVDVEEPFRVERTDDEPGDIAKAIGRFVAVLEPHLRRDPSQWVPTEDFWAVHACG
ncbi:MAG: lysophospholipid acyltransferase family protein [Dehalococcoidia bacterium]